MNPWDIFFKALETDDIAGLEAAVSAGLNVNATDCGDGTPLMFSCGCDSISKRLIELGADVNLAFPGQRLTALHSAASNGETSTVKLLLEHGADPNAATACGEPTEFFFDPLRGETPLHLAAAYGDLEMVKALLDSGADNTVLDGHQTSALRYFNRHKGDRDGQAFRKLLEFTGC